MARNLGSRLGRVSSLPPAVIADKKKKSLTGTEAFVFPADQPSPWDDWRTAEASVRPDPQTGYERRAGFRKRYRAESLTGPLTEDCLTEDHFPASCDPVRGMRNSCSTESAECRAQNPPPTFRPPALNSAQI